MIASIVLSIISASQPPPPTMYQDSNGWTVVTASSGSRIVYVSTSGSDSDDGLSSAKPKATLQAGYDLMRDNTPDHLLLKRGDVWTTSFPNWRKSGKDADEPMYIGAYGSTGDRPKIEVTADSGLTAFRIGEDAEFLHDIVIQSIEFERLDRENDIYAHNGVNWLYPTNRLLLEDLKATYFFVNFLVDPQDSEKSEDVSIRRCTSRFACTYASGGHPQGLYTHAVDGLFVEGCLFDHNGWDLTTGNSAPTIYRHNVYIQATCSNVTFNSNITARASSHGVQVRPGGNVRGNICYSNPHNMLLGTTWTHPEPITFNALQNVIQGSGDITSTNEGGHGIDIEQGDDPSGTVGENLILYGGGSQKISMGIGNSHPLENIDVRDNFIHSWGGQVRFEGALTDGISGVEFSGNTIQEAGPCFWQENADPYAWVNYTDSTFVCASLSSFIKVGTATDSFTTWQSAATDTGTNASAGSYAALLGLDDAAEEFYGSGLTFLDLIEARAQKSRFDWDAHLTAPAIVPWMLDQVGIDYTAP